MLNKIDKNRAFLNPDDHFADVRNMVNIGSGARRELEDICLSRYVCYLIVQNADPTKEKDIHSLKGLSKNQKILDHMVSTELAANLFRATQTEDKLKREQITGKNQANVIHHEVGQTVRA